jgi:hypothetical protein
MLDISRQKLPEGCITDLTFDEWHAGELDEQQVRELQQHVNGCARCQARHQALKMQASDFLGRYPELELPERRKVVPLRPRKAIWAWTTGAASLAAAAVLLLVLRPDSGQEVNGGGTRVKGGSRIGFHVEHDGRVRSGSSGQVVHPGDRLRFVVTTTEPQHVAILSLDAAGAASVYYPSTAISRAFGLVRNQPVETGVELDATLGRERLWGIFCDEPFDVEPLRQALEGQAKLPPLPGCAVDELSLTKEPPP